jgi:SAM-dependent methyltransferase
MFFADRVHLAPGEGVLEVGPGATPHPGSHVFLEKRFPEYEAFRQRGGLPAKELNKPVIYYDGDRFPFRDHEFDYVICSHVLEHVDNVEMFLRELARVASRGYIEFPTIYYEYLYNFDEHVNFVAYKEGELLWMPKKETNLHDFEPMQRFLVKTLESGYDDTIRAMKEIFFHGFEWDTSINARRVRDISELVPPVGEIPIRTSPSRRRSVLDWARNLSAWLRR